MATKDIKFNYISINEMFDIVKNVMRDSNIDISQKMNVKDLAYKVNSIVDTIAETLDSKVQFIKNQNMRDILESQREERFTHISRNDSDDEPSYGYNEWKYAKNNPDFFVKGQSSFDFSKKL